MGDISKAQQREIISGAMKRLRDVPQPLTPSTLSIPIDAGTYDRLVMIAVMTNTSVIEAAASILKAGAFQWYPDVDGSD